MLASATIFPPPADIDNRLFRAIMVHVFTQKTPPRGFMLLAVSTGVRELVKKFLLGKDGGAVLAATIKHALHRMVWLHHRACIWDYNTPLRKYLLTIVAGPPSKLGAALITTASRLYPTPALRWRLLKAAAAIAFTPELRKQLQLEEPDTYLRKKLFAISTEAAASDSACQEIRTQIVGNTVRRICDDITHTMSRASRERLRKASGDIAQELVRSVADMVDPAQPALSLIAWAALQEKFTVETAWRVEKIPTPLRHYCHQWLQQQNGGNTSALLPRCTSTGVCNYLYQVRDFTCGSPDCSSWRIT
jgi:hypothetical protein